MAENNNDAPKIHVDSDWKAQARAEKERLAQQAESASAPSSAGQAPPKPDAGAAEGPAPAGPRELPPADFPTLVSSLATQALISLGAGQDPRGGERNFDPDLAKHFIDTLAVLEEKTRGNLSDDEKSLLDQVLYECRMQYVQAVQAGL